MTENSNEAVPELNNPVENALSENNTLPEEKDSADPTGAAKYFAYFKERFPIPGVGLYAGLMFYACYFFGAISAHQYLPGEVRSCSILNSILGFIVVFLVFFHLRVLDEHKDYEDDVIAHPDRLLSRGIITLAELRRMLYATLVIEVGITAYLGNIYGMEYLILWGLILVWSLLMFKEFFVREWLKERLGVYLITHQLLVPFMGLYAMEQHFPVKKMLQHGLGQTALFFLGLMWLTVTFEMARKTWSKDREHEHADSYTRVWGIPRTVVTTLVISGGALAIMLYFFSKHPVSPVASITVCVLHAAFLVIEIIFSRNPVRKNSKLVETLGAVYMLGAFLTMAIAFA